MSIYSEAPEGLDWRTSRTCDGGACVGVTRQGEFVIVGNTANPEAPVSRFTAQEWRAFLAGAKLGDFDDLILGRLVPMGARWRPAGGGRSSP